MAKQKNIGRCRLCLNDGVELQNSHFMPAAVYKAMIEENSPNRNPVVITPHGAKPTSQQQKAPLLCRDCEQRFSKNGEEWTMTHFLRADGKFAIADILRSTQPLFVSADPTQIYLTDGIPEINRDALIYFAASMFWRGSIYPWRSDGTYPVNLGSKYENEFRLFLMGQSPFPTEASLMVVVRDGGPLASFAYNPAGGRIRDSAGENLGYGYRFPMPGFVFVLSVGKGRMEKNKQFCIVRGEGYPIIMTSKTEQYIEQDALLMGRKAMEAIAARRGRKTGR